MIQSELTERGYVSELYPTSDLYLSLWFSFSRLFWSLDVNRPRFLNQRISGRLTNGKSLIDAYTAVNTNSVCWHDSPDFSYSEMLTGLIRQASKPIDGNIGS